MAYFAHAMSADLEVEACRRLRRQVDNYRQIPILDFDEDSTARFLSLRRARFRIGNMDLKIAAIVLSHAATLLSGNPVDFAKVPGLPVEDWTESILQRRIHGAASTTHRPVKITGRI